MEEKRSEGHMETIKNRTRIDYHQLKDAIPVIKNQLMRRLMSEFFDGARQGDWYKLRLRQEIVEEKMTCQLDILSKLDFDYCGACRFCSEFNENKNFCERYNTEKSPHGFCDEGKFIKIVEEEIV